MEAEVYRVELLFVDTETGSITFWDGDEGVLTEARITSETRMDESFKWGDVVGTFVRAVVIDGWVKSIER